MVIDFKQDIRLDENALAEAISISPKVDGRYTLLHSRRVAFISDDYLAYDTEYAVKINTSLLHSRAEEGEYLTLRFQTKPLKLDIDIDPLTASNDDGWHIKGKIAGNDIVKVENITGMLRLKSKGQKIQWLSDKDGREFSFIIPDIERKDRQQSITLHWAGGKWDKSFNGEVDIDIPASGVFELADAQVMGDGSPQIILSFTDIIQAQQNFQGLITITDQAVPNYHVDGSQIIVYPKDETLSVVDVHISGKILNKQGIALGKDVKVQLNISPLHPAVRLLGQGTIVSSKMPASVGFEALNVRSVEVEVLKIYRDNILQFLQGNQISGDWYLEQVGKVVHTERIELDKTSDIKRNKWGRYALDLNKFISADPGAIYQVRIGFKPEYVLYPCASIVGYTATKEGESFMRYIYDYEGYSYLHEEDPCYGAFYSAYRFSSRNVLISDIATTVKSTDDHQYYLSVTDINTAQPVSNAIIEFFDFQQQSLGKVTSSSTGSATTQLAKKASFAVVHKDNSFNYLRLEDAEVLSLTDFETQGRKRNVGLDGFIYSDRGVYRPGDTIHVHFMLDDNEKLPKDHPVTLVLTDPQGAEKNRQVVANAVGGIYSFVVPTLTKDKTGLWSIAVGVGPVQFYHNIRIETIKPNKLKIEIKAPEEISAQNTKSNIVAISSSWLYGVPARNLRARVEAVYQQRETSFKGFDNFLFTDEARTMSGDPVVLFDGTLDQEGHGNIPLNLSKDFQFPGKIRANLATRVFEKGGDYSEHYSQIFISPYTHYVGLSIPMDKWGMKSFSRNTSENVLDLVSLDENGQVAANRKLSIGIYDIQWRWWYYENERYNLYNLNADNHAQAVWTNTITTNLNGKASINLDFNKVQDGRKMIRICDTQSGHCTSDFFYLSSWDMMAVEDERNSLNKIQITTDKMSYNVGDRVKLSVPTEAGNQLLVSIENGREVIFQDWLTARGEQTDYEFTLSENMSPNIYIHISMIQSTAKRNNLPIRMYGIAPIQVIDKSKKLQPIISAPNSLSANKLFSIEVSEADSKEMYYTVAIVDEGLLSLTNFHTPSPYDHFYAKRALAIKTWDSYDDILQGAGDGFSQIISVGGDGEGIAAGNDKQAMRFKPVVMTAGPFKLSRGKRQKHEFIMPNYFGAVRAMVIAKQNNAYGHGELSIEVKDPLMVFGTVPRTLSIGESFTIPVNLISTRDNLGSVELSIKTSALLQPTQTNAQRTNLEKAGEKMLYIPAKVSSEPGIANIEIKANATSTNASQQVEVDVRNPMPQRFVTESKLLAAGQTWESTIAFFGTTGTNKAVLELTQIPPLKLESRLNYLIRYPFGCLEQTTSAVFPQLYLDKLTALSPEQIKKMRININQGINRIQHMQVAAGGFSYWSGEADIDEWASIYALHFMVEAQQAGYVVPSNTLDKSLVYEYGRATKFISKADKTTSEYRSKTLTQAYRLYVLALAGKYHLSAMNLLRLEIGLPNVASFLLAGAYGKSGNAKVAYDLVKNSSSNVDAYGLDYWTYGSDLRDMALIAQAALDTDRSNDGFSMLKTIAEKLNTDQWYSTQSVAQSLLAVGKYVSRFKRDNLKADLALNNGNVLSIDHMQPLFLMDLNVKNQEKYKVTNRSAQDMYVTLVTYGQDNPSQMESVLAENSNIGIRVVYKNLDGSSIDVKELVQGTDFIAEISIINPRSRGTSLDRLALNHIIPSGWEIRNTRINNTEVFVPEDEFDYRDIRDDRIHTFFALNTTKTFRIFLNAAYLGEFYLPPMRVEAMYDHEIYASTKGDKVRVVQAQISPNKLGK